MKLLANIDRALSPGRGRVNSRDQGGVAGSEFGSRVELAGAIGERYESLQGGLDKLTSLVEQLRTAGPILEEMREPLQAEYDARRADYVELVNLRTTQGEASNRIESLLTELRALTEARSQAEQRQDDLTQQLADQVSAGQEAQLELDQARTALAKAEVQVQGLLDAEQDAAQRLRQLEQDLETVRTQLKEADDGRSEAASGRTTAQRELALVSEENGALKKRVDEALAEVARLARVETSLDSQLSTERTRAANDQAEASRAIHALEGQAEAARTEAAALQVRLDTLTARAERLERLNSDLTTSLNEAQAAAQASERRVSHLQLDLNRAVDRLRELQAQGEDNRQRLSAMDAARLAAVERAEHLSKSSTAQERNLARNEARLAKLQSALDETKTQAEMQDKARQEQLDSLRAQLEGVQTESAMTAAALDLARRDRVVERQALAAVG